MMVDRFDQHNSHPLPDRFIPDCADDVCFVGSAGLYFDFVMLCRVGVLLPNCVHKGERRPSGAAALRNAGQSNHRSRCRFNEPMRQEMAQPSLVERIAVYSLTGTVPGSMKRIDCRNSLTCFKSSSLAAVVKRVSRHDPQRKITSCKWRPSGSS